MQNPIEGAKRLEALGVYRAMLPGFFFAGPDGIERLRRFGEQVIQGR